MVIMTNKEKYERDNSIIKDRFEDKLSFNKIGLTYGISTARVASICNNHLRKKKNKVLYPNVTPKVQKEYDKVLEMLNYDTTLYSHIYGNIRRSEIYKDDTYRLLERFNPIFSIESIKYLYENHPNILLNMSNIGPNKLRYICECIKKYERRGR